MIESLTSGEIKAIRGKISDLTSILKEIDKICISGEKIHDLREFKTRTEHFRMGVNVKTEPNLFHRFIDRHKEIFIDYIKRKNKKNYYVITVADKIEGQADNQNIINYMAETYEKALEIFREEIRKYINSIDLVLF